MTETSKATCATCPWWEEQDPHVGACHHTSAMADPDDIGRKNEWYCEHHPGRRLPDPTLQRIAAALEMLVGRTPTGQGLTIGEGKILPQAPTWEEAAMIAEAKRRQGGGA